MKATNDGTGTSRIYYGWVIVGVSALFMAVAYGTMFSYSVFFKPIVRHFSWDRATVSSIYSVSLILRGAVSIGIGWLADRYGARKITTFCGLMIGLGLIFAGWSTTLWQFYLSYGLILSIGLSGSFNVSTSITSQWFQKKRAVPVALVSTGSGLGTLIIVPLAERLIQLYDWSTVFLIFGVGAGLLVTLSAFLLHAPPDTVSTTPNGDTVRTPIMGKTLREGAFSREMIMLMVIFSLSFFCVQMVMIHLVNYTTDIGIDSLQAAGLISTIGVVSIFGRLTMGSASDRFGTHNSLIICTIIRISAFVWLFFCSSLADFYLFAALFGFSYGGEIPQIPMFVSHIFGTRAMAALMGLLLFVSNVFAAVGPLLGGKIYDLTLNYQYAFAVALAASLLVFTLAVWFKKMSPATQE